MGDQKVSGILREIRDSLGRATVQSSRDRSTEQLLSELRRGSGSILNTVMRGFGNIGGFIAANNQSTAALGTAAAAQMEAAAALTAAAGALASAAGGSGGTAGDANWFATQAFGGKLDGLFKGGLPQILRSIGSGIGGRTGSVMGAAAAGAALGARGAGFGIAGLGKAGGALLGGAITGGLTAALLFGLPKLFGQRPSPAERNREIEALLERNRVTWPEPIEREIGFSSTGADEADAGYDGRRRVAPSPQIVVNVSAMDARSFMDRATDIASAVRRAMLDMHPINGLVREAF